MKMFFDQKCTPYDGFKMLEAASPLPLSDGDQMMPQGIIRNSLGDASRHDQEIVLNSISHTVSNKCVKKTLHQPTQLRLFLVSHSLAGTFESSLVPENQY